MIDRAVAFLTWWHRWRDPEEKFTFAVCAVARVIVTVKVWFE